MKSSISNFDMVELVLLFLEGRMRLSLSAEEQELYYAFEKMERYHEVEAYIYQLDFDSLKGYLDKVLERMLHRRQYYLSFEEIIDQNDELMETEFPDDMDDLYTNTMLSRFNLEWDYYLFREYANHLLMYSLIGDRISNSTFISYPFYPVMPPVSDSKKEKQKRRSEKQE